MKLWGPILAAALVAATALGASAQTLTLRLGSAVGPQDPTTLQLEALAARVAERSGGRLTLDVIPIETVSLRNVDSLRAVQQGVVDVMHLIPYYLTRDEPLFGVFAPHGLLVEAEQNLDIVDTQYDIAAEVLQDNWGMSIIARAPFAGLRDIVLMSKAPIRSLDDLRKTRLRHFTRDGQAAFNALGVSAQVVPSSELYLALHTGVVDAAVYGPTYARSQSIYEVTDYITYMGAFAIAYPFALIATDETLARIPDDLRAILAEESQSMWDEGIRTWRQGAPEAEAYAWLTSEGGMTMLDPLPLEDRMTIQRELMRVWREGCAAMGERALGYCTRIEQALSAPAQ